MEDPLPKSDGQSALILPEHVEGHKAEFSQGENEKKDE